MTRSCARHLVNLLHAGGHVLEIDVRISLDERRPLSRADLRNFRIGEQRENRSRVIAFFQSVVMVDLLRAVVHREEPTRSLR